MSSAIYFNLDQSKILSSGRVLKMDRLPLYLLCDVSRHIWKGYPFFNRLNNKLTLALDNADQRSDCTFCVA